MVRQCRWRGCGHRCIDFHSWCVPAGASVSSSADGHGSRRLQGLQYCVPMAMLDADHPDLAVKLHWIMFPMLFCPVYETGADGKPLSPTAAVKARVDRFLAGEWRTLWSDALSLTGQKSSTLPKVKTKEQDKAARALRAEHQVLAGQPREAHRTLMSPGLFVRPVSRCTGTVREALRLRP